MGMRDRRRRCRIYRRMKGENAERAKTVVGSNLGLRIELSNRVTLMEMAEGKELRYENQNGGEERNRPCAAPDQYSNFSSTRSHRPNLTTRLISS